MRLYRNFKRKRKERRGFYVRRRVYLNDPKENSRISYPSNYVKTSRYNILTFLPLNLWEQLHRVANVFFVVMMVLSMLPISPVQAAPQIMAVACILGFQALKDAYEDYMRHKSDNEINCRKVEVIRPGYSDYLSISWESIVVGDIVKVPNNSEIPADLLLLSSTMDDGQCFLETANLDGESNLKLRSAHPKTAECLTFEQLQALNHQIDADEPLERLYEFDGSITVEEDIFSGSIIEPGESEKAGGEQEESPLTIDNFLHRGTMLRNTEYVHGLVLYTGHQTKFMMNVSKPHHKMSRMEHTLNYCIISILIILIILCVLSAVIDVEYFEYYKTKDHWYIEISEINGDTGEFHETILSILTFIVVYGNLVPLSLYVNLEITRLIQAYLMECDWRMFDREKKRTPVARATNLMEELGQIDYIFADKTGTLTRNEMVFRVCSVGDRQYGLIPDIVQDDFDEEEEIRYLAEDSFLSSKLMQQRASRERESKEKEKEEANEGDYLLKDSIDFLRKSFGLEKKKEKKRVVETHKERDVFDDVTQIRPPNRSLLGSTEEQKLLLSMAICNTVVPASVQGNVVYQSSSPDETALVIGAKKAGFCLVSRRFDECVLDIFGEKYSFEILAINEFTSERRKMSVLLRMPDGSIQLFVKGADEAVFPLCSRSHGGKKSHAGSHGVGIAGGMADKFAEGGLRTLVFGQRNVSEEEFSDWAETHWNVARLAVDDRKGMLLQAAKLIEKDLEVVGVTGIEDRLQPLVPQTIEDLMRANIKVWILTGDKPQTAINIAQSCKVIQQGDTVIRIKDEEDSDKESIARAFLNGKSLASSSSSSSLSSSSSSSSSLSSCCLVIDGSALGLALDWGLENEIVELCHLCRSVVCCRATPIQKQQMVQLMKKHLPIRTLAIGDGANDVAMIQTAHVGVGVMGNEGMQAVMSSDFVIGQFRFLKRLLIIHGRWSFQRTGLMICYTVYKNVFLTLIPFWFGFFCQWSGEVYLDPWMRALWNFTFTGFPCVIFSFMEQDLPQAMILRHPELYREGQKNESFNGIKFFQWFMFSVWDGVVSFFGAILTNYGLGVAVNSNGINGDYWSCATLTYSIMCIVSNLHLFVNTRHWNLITHITYWGSLLSWFVVAPAYCTEACISMGVSQMYYVYYHLMADPLYWIALPVLSWLCLLPDIVPLYIQRTFYPRPVHILQEVANSEEWKENNPEMGTWCCNGESERVSVIDFQLQNSV